MGMGYLESNGLLSNRGLGAGLGNIQVVVWLEGKVAYIHAYVHMKDTL